jgi:signal transduction histidine kinase/ligand-binding sensor domain-containing protein
MLDLMGSRVLRLFSLILVLLLAGSAPIFAQLDEFSNQVYFKHFTTDQGLSEASVNCILKDQKGFLWFGTEDGLNRFDGNQFKVYINQEEDSTSISDNTILSLAETENGIWIGTSDNLNYYDRHLEKFSSYNLKGQEYYICSDIRLDQATNRLWIAADQAGLCYIDSISGEVNRYKHKDLEGVLLSKIVLAGDRLYLGTINSGLKILDLKTDSIITIGLHKDVKGNEFDLPIRGLLKDGDFLWIATVGDGVKKLNCKTFQVESYNVKNGKLSDDKVWSIAKQRDGHLWIGTDGGGVTVLNTKNGRIQVYQNSDYDTRTISGNTIRSVYVDDDDNVWLGTYNADVNYYCNFGINFLLFKKDPTKTYTLTHSAIKSFLETSDGTLWIGTDGGGLNYMKDQNFFPFKFPSDVEDPKVINCMLADKKGGMWLGTYQNGAYYISAEKKVKQFRNDQNKNNSISSTVVWAMAEDEHGDIYMATDNGLNKFDQQTKTFFNHRNKPVGAPDDLYANAEMIAMLLDSKQRLWMGLFGELQQYDIKTNSLTDYYSDENDSTSLPNNIIMSIFEDKKGKIWFGSYGLGLVNLNEVTKKFNIIDESKGLPNNLIFAIQNDGENNLWLSTNKGLIKFDQSKNTFAIFDQNFGVQKYPFKDNASYKTRTGYLLFGGTKGFNAFMPAEIKFNRNDLKVVFTGVQLFNKEIPIDGITLTSSITETKKISLTYDEAKFISIHFSALHYLAPELVNYEYMMEGFENSWQPANQSKNLTFTGLAPGRYLLHLRAGFPSHGLGDESILEINVIPPWWMTIYAKVIAGLSLVAFGFLFYRYRIYSLQKRERELEALVKFQSREIHEKNEDLTAQNEELASQNEELMTQSETINSQNEMLGEAQKQLREVNESLEVLVQHRTETLKETIIQLNKIIKELDAFLYSASHDLLSPLKSVLGLVLLARTENTNPSISLYLEHIESSVNKLELVIKSLMQHSINTKTSVKNAEVNFETIIEDAVNEARYMSAFDKINIEKEFVGNVLILTDDQRVKIIVSNLISNAIKYHDPAKKNNIVKIKFENNAEYWMLEVYDNGIGIAQPHLQRVFDLFYRATENAKGSGLGLYIVKEAVDKLQGKIEVKSELGKWCSFQVTIPNNSSNDTNN